MADTNDLMFISGSTISLESFFPCPLGGGTLLRGRISLGTWLLLESRISLGDGISLEGRTSLGPELSSGVI